MSLFDLVMALALLSVWQSIRLIICWPAELIFHRSTAERMLIQGALVYLSKLPITFLPLTSYAALSAFRRVKLIG